MFHCQANNTREKVSTDLRKKKSFLEFLSIYLFILFYLRGEESTIWPLPKLTGFFILKSIALNCPSPDVRSRMPSRAKFQSLKDMNFPL